MNIVQSEDFTPRTTHFRPLDLDLFLPNGNRHRLIIFIILPIIVVHLASYQLAVRLLVRFGRLVAELKLFIQVGGGLVLRIFLETGSQDHVADVLVLGQLKI
jgi:hypothetical protein